MISSVLTSAPDPFGPIAAPAGSAPGDGFERIVADVAAALGVHGLVGASQPFVVVDAERTFPERGGLLLAVADEQALG